MRDNLPTEYGAVSIYRICYSENARDCNTFQCVIIGRSIEKAELLQSNCDLIVSVAEC
jgi:hypothetical protein